MIHNAAFADRDLDWIYVAFPVAAGSAKAATEAMRTYGLGGLSVTTPHKADVAAAVDELSPSAQRLGAVNTVCWNGERLRGESTDGRGCVEALRAAGTEVQGCRVMVLGAGGAARSVVLAMADAGAHDIVVVNRTASNAQIAAELAGAVGRVGSADEADHCDIIVNATTLGMGDNQSLPVDSARLGPGQTVHDLVYYPLLTPLLLAAAAQGAKPIDGVDTLLHQAALQFALWTGETPSLDVMRAAARGQLG